MEDENADDEPRPEPVDFAGINALSSRAAGYAVALKCLTVQDAAVAADPSLKTGDRERLHDDAWSWYQGAIGEIEVGRLLAALGPEWFVRHSVPIGAGTKDVDHLVIGPGGVFAINTKHHAGASVWVGDHVLRVNGGNTHHLAAGRRDAGDVSRRLSDKVGFPVPVTPVIALFGARAITDRRAPLDRVVEVMDASQLLAWLRSQPAQLSSAKIELIKLAAEEPATWHVDPHAAETYRVMQRFERLVSRVSVAASPAPAERANVPARRRRPARATQPAVTPRPGRSRPARAPSKARSARKRAADEKNVIQTWVCGALVLAAVIIGTREAAGCDAVASSSPSAALGCGLAEGLKSFYPFGWWLAGGLLAIAAIMTVVHVRRR